MANLNDFKDIPGYENCYAITEDGIIKGLHFLPNERILKPATNVKGYFIVKLQKGGVKLNTSIHRLVAKTYIPNPLNLPLVNHKDGIKTNNHVSNLEWCTPAYNVHHAHSLGLCQNKKIWYQKDRNTYSIKFSGRNNPIAKKIINTETQTVYGCIQEAADSIGLTHAAMKNRLRGRVKNNTPLHYIS